MRFYSNRSAKTAPSILLANKKNDAILRKVLFKYPCNAPELKSSKSTGNKGINNLFIPLLRE